MNFFKKVWDKIKAPSGIWAILFYICFVLVIGGTITLVVLVQQQTVWHFVLYIVAAISLVYFVYSIVYFAPKMKEMIIRGLKKFNFTNTLLTNYGYRTIIFAIFSFILNLSYVVLVGTFALITRNAWYISISAYYLVLVLMKGNVFLSKRKKEEDEVVQLKTYRFTGIMFLVLTLAFSGIITLIYISNMYFEYAGIMIYVFAAFTFYKFTFAIVNIFKAKKQDDLYVQNIRNINFASALVSVMVLQVAMFQAFSPEYNTSFANALTGAVVGLFILAIGIVMIIKSNKLIKEKKNERQ